MSSELPPFWLVRWALLLMSFGALGLGLWLRRLEKAGRLGRKFLSPWFHSWIAMLVACSLLGLAIRQAGSKARIEAQVRQLLDAGDYDRLYDYLATIERDYPRERRAAWAAGMSDEFVDYLARRWADRERGDLPAWVFLMIDDAMSGSRIDDEVLDRLIRNHPDDPSVKTLARERPPRKPPRPHAILP